MTDRDTALGSGGSEVTVGTCLCIAMPMGTINLLNFVSATTYQRAVRTI